MTGSRYLAEAVHAYETTHLFYVNSIANQTMKEAKDLGVKLVVTHGEKAAAYMADGYARASRRPGVCLSQDIGSTNLLAGLRDARMSSSPLIAITGGQNKQPRYRHAYQNLEDFNAWSAVTKANFSIEHVDRLPDLLRQAFRTATTGAPGPVHLELRGNAGQMLETEGEFDLTFEQRYSRYPAFRLPADADAVQAAVALLKRAERPIIVAGGGAVASDAGAEIVKLAELLSIPIATALRGRSVVPDDHPLCVGVPGTYSRWCANKSVEAADLVMYIGSHTGGQVTNGWQIPKPGTPVIQLDIAPEELGRNYPNAVSLCGDAKTVVGQMIAVAGKGAPRRAKWIAQVQGYVADFWAESESVLASDATPIRPERMCLEIEQWLPDNAALVVDTFHAAMWSMQMIRLKAGQSYIACGGSLGWAFPAAIGVKAALPSRPVIGFAGDAGFYYHIGELETAIRAGLNIVMIVNSNYSGGVAESVRYDRSVSFAKVAEAMGCAGFRAEKPADVRSALDNALGAGRPAVVEVVCDPEVRAKRVFVPSAVSGE
jgi:acetolactate synthase-1/2/3 large subunit